MMRRQPRSTLSSSSAASDVYKRQLQLYDQVGHRAVQHRDAHGDAVQLALELGEHQRRGPGCAGRGRNDIGRAGSRPAQVLVRKVEDDLVIGVGAVSYTHLTLPTKRI